MEKNNRLRTFRALDSNVMQEDLLKTIRIAPVKHEAAPVEHRAAPGGQMEAQLQHKWGPLGRLKQPL